MDERNFEVLNIFKPLHIYDIVMMSSSFCWSIRTQWPSILPVWIEVVVPWGFSSAAELIVVYLPHFGSWTKMYMNGDDGVTSTTGVAKNATVDGGGNGGLVISTTEIMHSFLRTASVNTDLSQDLRDLASSLTQQTTVPYKSLKSIWVGCDPKSRPNILCLFSGSSFVFTSPKPREKV